MSQAGGFRFNDSHGISRTVDCVTFARCVRFLEASVQDLKLGVKINTNDDVLNKDAYLE